MQGKQDVFRVQGRLLPPSELTDLVRGEAFLDRLAHQIYGNGDHRYLALQQERYLETLKLHRERFGDRPACLLRAPGRLNLFTEYLDMCAGDHMSTTIDGDIPLAVSPAPEGSDRVRVRNASPLFPGGDLSIAEELERFRSRPWTAEAAEGIPDDWAWRSRITPYHGRKRGDPLNYVLAPYLRIAFEWPGVRLDGCDLTFGPSTIPLRAGTSSSSAVVVLSMLSLLLVNGDRLPPMSVRDVCRLLGEGEWYVGTRGGANDQTTILRNRVRGILYNLHHLPLIDSRSLPWLKGLSVIVCNTLWEADKALGARHVFNLRKGWMDLARDLFLHLIREGRARLERDGGGAEGWLAAMVGRLFPGHAPEGTERLEAAPEQWAVLAERFHHLGSLDESLLGMDRSDIEAFIGLLPPSVEPEAAGRVLSKSPAAMERDYTLPRAGEGGYRPRQAALFFHLENRIGRSLEALLVEADGRLASGEIDSGSEAYRSYRRRVARCLSDLQAGLRDVFQVSNSQIERCLAIASKGPGYLAGKLTGAGSGGCVCLLVEEARAREMLHWLDEAYFGVGENFAAYRRALGALADSGRREDAEKAEELTRNLDEALHAPERHRRVVTFSQGAGLVCP